MTKNLLDYIPKKYKNAVKEFCKDSDGYWLILNNDYALDGYGAAHVIHEDTVKDVLEILRQYLIKVF